MRTPSRSGVLAVCIWLLESSCESREFLPLPDSEGLRTIVLGRPMSATEYELSAYAATGRWLVQDGQEVVVFGYEGELSEYGLAAGTITTPGNCGLRFPKLALRREPLSRGFRGLPDAETILRRITPDCISCSPLTPTPVTLEVDEGVESALVLGPDSVLVSSSLERLELVTRTGVRRLDGCDIKAKAILGSPNHEIWLVHTKLERIELDDDGCTRTGSVALPAIAAVAAAVPGSDPLEIFILLEDKTVHRFRAGERSTERLLTLAVEGDLSDPAIVALGPDELLVHASTPEVFRWRDGELTKTPVELISPTRKGLDALVHVPGLGLFTGDYTGGVFIFDEDSKGWRPFALTGIQRAVSSIVPHRDGLVFFIDGGHVFKWSPIGGLCPEQLIAPELDGGAEAAFAVGDAIVAPDYVDGDEVSPGSLYWFDDR
ncbi:MAG: hypothetical protein HY791_23610 [Deltaproteobacteria bacterium]|nr:hypothetical protein [Deltaproteobacteria bacterium]